MENLFHCLINNSSLLLAIIVFSAIYFIITYCNIWEKSEKNKKNLQKRTDEAINLYRRRYLKDPEDNGFPVIGIYEKQNAFLYASSEKVIKAYKTQQNIIRWMLVWYFWPFPFAFVGTIISLAKYPDLTYPPFIAWSSFMITWSILGFVLCIKGFMTSRIVKFNNNITYLNY